MTDMVRVRRNHDRAMLVGQKLNGAHLDYLDLSYLLACCSDVPELGEEVDQLRERLANQERTIKAARKWAIRFSKRDMGDKARHAEASDLELLSSIEFLSSEK